MRIATATRPDPNSLSIPAAVRSTWIRELSLVACPAASNSARRRARSSRSIAVTGCIWAWRVKPCRPKCSGSYLIIDLNLCLWSPAFPVPTLSASFQQEFCEDLGIDLSPGHVVLDELEHPAVGGILRHDRAVVLPCEMQEPERVLHLAAKIALAPETQDGETHFSVSVSSVATSSPSFASVRSSPSTSTSSGRGAPSTAWMGGATATLRMNTCSAPDLIFNRSLCLTRTLSSAVRRRAAKVASA